MNHGIRVMREKEAMNAADWKRLMTEMGKSIKDIATNETNKRKLVGSVRCV